MRILNFDRWRTGTAELLAIGLLAFAMLMLSFVTQANSQPRPILKPGGVIRPLRAQPSRIVGTLALQVPGTKSVSASLVELTDIPVSLRVPGNAAAVATATTRLDGNFALQAPAAGLYEICGEIAGETTCGKRIQATADDQWAGTIAIPTERPVAYGKVLTADGRPCWVNDHFFDLDVSTQVVALDGTGNKAAAPVRANVQGEYAIFGLPVGRYGIIAECEKASAKAVATIRASSLQDLTLPNHAPRLTTMDASTAGVEAVRPVAGAVIDVAASAIDRDNDPIEYLWRTIDADPSVSATAGATLAWRLPPRNGLHSVYLMARDGRGGFAYRRFDLRTGDVSLTFSGSALDETNGAPIVGAVVSIGSVTVKTNSRGWFVLPIKPRRDARYVLNIKHPAFALVSRVYDRARGGETYEMIRSQVGDTPAKGGLVLVDKSSSGPCGTGPDGRKSPPRQLARRELYDWGDGGKPLTAEQARLLQAMLAVDDNAVQAKCPRRGIEIRIPENALVDSSGRPAATVTSSIATLDATRRALPGDYRAVDAGGDTTQLMSYGAAYAEFRGPAGEKLQLAKGETAELTIPVPAGQVATAKSTIPLWSYDELRGAWIEEGEAKLTATPDGPAYVGKTSHFSTINADIKLTGGTCARFHVPPGTFTGWSNLTLRAYVSFGGTTSQAFTTPLNGDDLHALFRIPFGPASAPNTLRISVEGSFAGQPVVLLNNIVNIDQIPPVSTSDAYSYPAPYVECGTPIEIALPSSVIPAYALDATGRPYFLTGPYGDFNPAPSTYDPAQYYATIDPPSAANPQGLRSTLGGWWLANGFGADGQGTGNSSFTRAAYLNHNDLGFGRDMRCAKTPNSTGSGLACYVTNYGLPDQSGANADAAAAHAAGTAGATVAMEFNPAAALDDRVQFYVYGGGAAAASTRLSYADLDGFGPKPVPQLCTVCHGGRYNAATKTAAGSSFREFDLPSFKYSGNRQWDYGQAVSATTPSAAEFVAYRGLNKMVHDIAQPSVKIRALIEAWYGPTLANPRPILPPPPGGAGAWPDPAVYHGPYGKTCRTCHVARTLDFTSQAAFSSTSSVVCGSYKVMPNAVVTYKNFWADASRVLQYETAAGLPAGTCKNG